MLFDMKEKEAGEMLLLIIRVGFWWILVLMSFNLVGAALLELKHVLHLAHMEKHQILEVHNNGGSISLFVNDNLKIDTV